MNKERIEKAVEVINYAMKNQISVREASLKCGYADTYVKNTKAILYEKYENGMLDDELFTLFDDAYKQYAYYRGFGIVNDYSPKTDLSQLKVPSQWNITNTAADNGTKFNQKGNEATAEWKSSNYPLNHIKTLSELLAACEVDLDIWQVKEHTVNKWDTTSMKGDAPQTIQNFQVKARLEKNLVASKEKAIGEIFIDMVKNYMPSRLEVPIKPKTTVENNLFEITLFDLHMGKLCWKNETGENYDLKIASKRFLTTIRTLIDRAKGFEYSRILFPIGSDFFNTDTILNTTTAGTPQDEDARWKKTFSLGIRLVVDAINMLKQTGVPVDVMGIAGNHDLERSYYLGACLEAWFNNDSQVHINNEAPLRKYYRFGKVLLGLTHGSEEKESSLSMLMANDVESKSMWGETLYHEWHLGHIHRKRTVKYTTLDASRVTNEELGVTVRYLSSLTGTDAWHFSKGFIGATKAGEAFIWNDEAGLVAHLNANLIIE